MRPAPGPSSIGDSAQAQFVDHARRASSANAVGPPSDSTAGQPALGAARRAPRRARRRRRRSRRRRPARASAARCIGRRGSRRSARSCARRRRRRTASALGSRRSDRLITATGSCSDSPCARRTARRRSLSVHRAYPSPRRCRRRPARRRRGRAARRTPCCPRASAGRPTGPAPAPRRRRRADEVARSPPDGSQPGAYQLVQVDVVRASGHSARIRQLSGRTVGQRPVASSRPASDSMVETGRRGRTKKACDRCRVPQRVENTLDAALDQALAVQRPVVLAYLDRAQRKDPTLTPAAAGRRASNGSTWPPSSASAARPAPRPPCPASGTADVGGHRRRRDHRVRVRVRHVRAGPGRAARDAGQRPGGPPRAGARRCCSATAARPRWTGGGRRRTGTGRRSLDPRHLARTRSPASTRSSGRMLLGRVRRPAGRTAARPGAAAGHRRGDRRRRQRRARPRRDRLGTQGLRPAARPSRSSVVDAR